MTFKEQYDSLPVETQEEIMEELHEMLLRRGGGDEDRLYHYSEGIAEIAYTFEKVGMPIKALPRHKT